MALLTSQFSGYSLLVLYRMMQQPLDLVKPAVFADILFLWLPGADAKNHHVSQHGARLLSWMTDNKIASNYSSVIKAHNKQDVLDYERTYEP